MKMMMKKMKKIMMMKKKMKKKKMMMMMMMMMMRSRRRRRRRTTTTTTMTMTMTMMMMMMMMMIMMMMTMMMMPLTSGPGSGRRWHLVMTDVSRSTMTLVKSRRHSVELSDECSSSGRGKSGMIEIRMEGGVHPVRQRPIGTEGHLLAPRWEQLRGGRHWRRRGYLAEGLAEERGPELQFGRG